MKKRIIPILEYLKPEEEDTFVIRKFDLPYFSTPWHYHPEFELVFIIKGEGKRIVGNSISDFQEGQLSFLGPKIPHIYQNPSAYYQHNSSLGVSSIVLHFLPEAFGNSWFSLPEFKKVHLLFKKSKMGLDLHGEARKLIIEKMFLLVEAKGIKRLIYFFQILDILIETKEFTYITDEIMITENVNDAKRLSNALLYIYNNFQYEISLDDVARTAFMTRNSFCRFFKLRTKKTFSSLLKDLRLNHSVKLMLNENLSVREVAFRSGYSNLANFNRHFKKKYELTPLEYVKKHKII
ncbi:AraC family transcriptional regulator [Pedobacter glucosidilyticus]|uniref:AraC family transcriptional regulator n=1 Tax=Pedobacter glucosidilyticus TaxID=1122941 RepID=UPI0026F13976|nr:AraC family transcriptional regulator [Pedobacter glucosidilyticus]